MKYSILGNLYSYLILMVVDFIISFLEKKNREIPGKLLYPSQMKKCNMIGNSSKVNAAKGGVSSVCEPLPPDRPLWFPGSTPPQWLDGR